MNNEQESMAVVHDKMHELGFSRDEDWFIRDEGGECEEIVHIDTLAKIHARIAKTTIPDPPEAPIWLDSAEASAWQSGWHSGFSAAVAKEHQS